MRRADLPFRLLTAVDELLILIDRTLMKFYWDRKEHQSMKHSIASPKRIFEGAKMRSAHTSNQYDPVQY